jgi:hypothetical protein
MRRKRQAWEGELVRLHFAGEAGEKLQDFKLGNAAFPSVKVTLARGKGLGG